MITLTKRELSDLALDEKQLEKLEKTKIRTANGVGQNPEMLIEKKIAILKSYDRSHGNPRTAAINLSCSVNTVMRVWEIVGYKPNHNQYHYLELCTPGRARRIYHRVIS